MDANRNTQKHGISLKLLNYVMAGITLIVSVTILLSIYQTNKGYAKMRDATEHYIDWQQSANEMQIASDYLTDQVQSFSVTGERQYLDGYFEEAKVTRRRDNAIAILRDNLGDSKAYGALQNAMQLSMELMNREYYSMRLMIEALGMPLSEQEQEIQNVVLSETDASASVDKKKETARQIVHDEIYHLKKEAIKREVDICFSHLVNETENSESKAMDNLRVTLSVQQVLIFLLIAVVIVVVLLTSVQVISPLIKAVPHIRDEKPLPVEGAYEYRYLAKTYNKMYEANRKSKEMLEFEATHDNLTGLVNRAGYEEYCRRFDLSKAALILIDIDRFKFINDSFGHDVGDRALQRVSQAMAGQFRSVDAICRIGGDEFVVLMENTGRENADKIGERIALMNEILAAPPVGEQPISVSCGTAFGHDGIDAEDLFRNADRALYKVKQNGRHGFAVYED